MPAAERDSMCPSQPEGLRAFLQGRTDEPVTATTQTARVRSGAGVARGTGMRTERGLRGPSAA